MSHIIRPLALALVALTAVGCADDAESDSIEVSFDVSVVSAEDAQGPVVISFFRTGGTFENPTLSLIDTVQIPGLGKKTHSITFSDRPAVIKVRAVDDADGDGKCSYDELWNETSVTIQYIGDTAIAGFANLNLTSTYACPD